MKTNVYIDGFNLYYRAVKDTPFKWLDLAKVCRMLLPSHQINRIRYFTAQALPLPNDPDIQTRQRTYIRALQAIPNLTVHWGQFKLRTKIRPLASPPVTGPRYIYVRDIEEKGSDVNLATYLLIDAYERDFEQAVVVSNDSDLALPIQMVIEKLRLPVGVVNPNIDNKHHAPRELTLVAKFVRQLRRSTLRNCQFDPTLKDQHGIISKPSAW